MYSLNYIQKLVELLSPDKRDDSIVALNKPAFNDIQNLHDNLFFTFKQYQAISVWTSGTYAKNAKVKYQKSIYQSLVNGNTTTPTDVSWVLVSPNFFGVDNLIKIRGEKLVLEYALNLWFDTVYRQPYVLSDIYLTLNTAIYQSPFKVGDFEIQCSKVTTVGSSDFIGIDYTFLVQYGFTINVPIAVFNALGSDDTIRENIVRDFADKYVNCGIKYNVQTY